MGLKADLQNQVEAIFKSRWTERDGSVVPDDDSVTMGNDAVKIRATVLYADLADSTEMVTSKKPWYSAEVYKTFLHCSAKVIKSQNGTITAYDGDRIMAVYIGDRKNTNAVKSALQIHYVVSKIINPAKDTQYPTAKIAPVRFVIGIDTSELFVAKTGVRGANDLVWVGRAANYAAKLAAMPSTNIYVTSEVFSSMNDSVKTSDQGHAMWTAISWDAFDGRTVYRSSWWQSI